MSDVWTAAAACLDRGERVTFPAVTGPFVPAPPAARNPADFAVIVTTHGAYLPYLRECLDSIDIQTHQPAEKVLCIDSAPFPEWILADYPSWSVLRGGWGDPNAARNAAIAQTAAEWLVVIDGDNWMHPAYLEGMAGTIAEHDGRLGQIYAHVDLCNDLRLPLRRHKVPGKPDYWRLRLANYASGSGAMRRAALVESGGWQDTECWDDWAVACNMTARGWTQAKAPVPILARHGSDTHRRHKPDAGWAFAWEQRTYALVCLMAGRRQCLGDWFTWLREAELPARTALYIQESSGDRTFTQQIWTAVNSVSRRFTHVDLSSVPAPHVDLARPYVRARLVGDLYNRILPRVREDMLVTIEDDIIPPLSGLRELVRLMPGKGDVGAAGGAYLSRRGKGRICAARGPDYVYDRVFSNELTSEPMRVGCMGGGFTVWHNALVKRSLPFRFEVRDGTPTGWDTILCQDIAAAGYRLLLHGGVECKHLVEAGK